MARGLSGTPGGTRRRASPAGERRSSSVEGTHSTRRLVEGSPFARAFLDQFVFGKQRNPKRRTVRIPPIGDTVRPVGSGGQCLFDALFARCDAERANALLAADVEFYDDRTGLSAGEDLREDFRRLTENCPAGHGVRRILLPESVEVYPIEGFGAVQTGVHHFVERGASTRTVAKLVNRSFGHGCGHDRLDQSRTGGR